MLTQGRGQDVALMQVSRAKVATRMYSYVPPGVDEPEIAKWGLGRKVVFQKETELAVIVEREAKQELLGRGQRRS